MVVYRLDRHNFQLRRPVDRQRRVKVRRGIMVSLFLFQSTCAKKLPHDIHRGSS